MGVPNLRAIRDWCKESFLSKQEILDSKDSIESNNDPGKLADALVIKEVFQSVSNGKELIASAITDKGIRADASDSFAEMADKITRIDSSGGSGGGELTSPITMHIETGTGTANSAGTVGGINIMFFPIITKPKKVVIRNLIMGGYKQTSNAPSQYFYFRIGCKKEGANTTSYQNIKSFYINGTTAQTSTSEEIEIDLSDIDELSVFQIYKTTASGTTYMIYYRLSCDIDLYF